MRPQRNNLRHLSAAAPLLFLSLSWSTLHAMDVSTGVGAPYSLHLKGTIERGDYDKILRIIHRARGFPNVAFIKSPGGDVVEAMKIAKLLHKGRVWVWAVSKVCNSACFLIVAGSAQRLVEVSIGLHRPRYDDLYFAGLSSKDAEAEYRKLDELVRQFLKANYVPEDIIDTMMATPSDRVVFMAPEEFERRIGKLSPGYGEWLLAKCGSMSQQEKEDQDANIHLYGIERVERGEGNLTVFEFGTGDDIERIERRSGVEVIITEEDRKQAEPARHFSEGYRNYLHSKYMNIQKCELTARQEAQKKANLEILRE